MYSKCREFFSLFWDTNWILLMLCAWGAVLHLALIKYWAVRMQAADGEQKLAYFVEMADAANLSAIGAAGRQGRDFETKHRARFVSTLLAKLPKLIIKLYALKAIIQVLR